MSKRIYQDCSKVFEIKDNGLITAGDTQGYDSLVLADNDIPNKAYVDAHGGGASGYSGWSGFSGAGGSGASGYSGYSGAKGDSGISGYSGAGTVGGADILQMQIFS